MWESRGALGGDNMYRICAVVVTFNRKELLLRNLNAVLSQTYPADILVFDNHSTDGTESYLRDNGILSLENLHYHYSDCNLGGAGGFCGGMKIAYDLGYDMVWLMDDDGYCLQQDTLQKLIDCVPDEPAPFILNSTVVCDEKNTLTFGFLDITTYEQLKEKADGDIYRGYINPFNSTLVSRRCIEAIGFPKGEFFLYGDEHEYMLRAKKNNIDVITVVNSLYYHPVNRKIEYKRIWKYDIPNKQEPVWKTFCDTRNNIYITRKYNGWKILLIRIFVSVAAAFLKKEKKLTYIKYTCLGIMDGFREKFDRPIMFDK